MLRRVFTWLKYGWQQERRERELEEELAFHLEEEAEELEALGLPPERARRSARLDFGNPSVVKEATQDVWGWRAVEDLARDVRYATRMLVRNPMFTSVAVACLALGIGANTAVFSLFNAVMLRALPVSHPEQLVFFQHSGYTGDISAVRRLSSGYGQASLPYATYEAFRDHAPSLAGVFVFAAAGGMEGNGLTVNVGGRPTAANGEMVTGSYFSVLGVSPVLGRAIVDDDLTAGSANVAVVSHAFWSREFSEDPSAVGGSINVNGTQFTIAGVAPPGFAGLLGATTDVWVPLRPTDDMRPWGSRTRSGEAIFADRKWWWCSIGARLKAGVQRSQARSETDFLFRQSITAGVSTVPPNLPNITLSDASPVFQGFRRKYSAPLRILAATSALVLLIACINLAALLLARARARQKEIGVRLAIGASRARLVRQLLTESVLLSVVGGILGMLIALWGGSAVLRLILGNSQATPLNVSPDGTVFAFAAAVSLATGVLFGLAPAWRATRVDLAPQLKEAASSTTPHLGLGRLLVVSQIALSVVLLYGAGLFVRTFRNLDGQHLGFERENLLLFAVDPERSGYKDASGIALHARLLERIQGLPGVRSATYSQDALLSGWHSSSPTGTDGAPLPSGQPNEVYYNRVGPGYFETMGMRVLLGHSMGWRNAGPSHPAAVVNESWARAFFPGENPVGHRLSVGGDKLKPDRAYEIVGVAVDAKFDRMREAPPRTVYISYGANWDRSRRMWFAARTAGDPLALTAAVRAAIREIDPNLPMFNVNTQSRQIGEALAQERMLAQLASFFGGLALLLVSVGIYGTLSYAVTQRTAEIGIRMALGARRREVVWIFLRESLAQAALGLAVGLPVALALARLATSSLFGIRAHDGMTVAVTVIILSLIAAVSGFLPANRASRIDPNRALRNE